MMSASATAFATIKRFITFRLLENRIYENRLEYAYSARRFLPLISLNVFGGRINQPLKKNDHSHCRLEAGGGGQLSCLNELKCRMHEGSEGRRQQLKCVFVCYVVHHFCLYFKESKFLWTLQLLTEFLTFHMLICSSGRSSIQASSSTVEKMQISTVKHGNFRAEWRCLTKVRLISD